MKHKLLFLIFILTCLFLSFYKTESLFQIGYDQERDYQIVQSIASQKHLTLLGPRVVSESGFYLGPWYYYTLAPFFVLLRGYPAFAAYATNLVTFLTALLLFIIFKKRSPLLGATASLFWLSAPHRIAWNVMFIPLFCFALIDLLLQKPELKKLLIINFIWGLSLNFHPQMIFFLPSILVYFYDYARQRSLLTSLKHLIYMIVVGSLPFLPLVAFDLRHQFTNLYSLLHFAAGQASPALNFVNRLIYSNRQFARSFGTGTVGFHPVFLLIASALAIIIAHKNRRLLSLFLVPIFSLLTLSLYRQSTWPEYYQLAGVTVLTFLIFYTFWNLISTKVVLCLITIIVFIFSLRTLLTKTDPLSFLYQKNLMLYILTAAKPYNRPNITYNFPLGEGNGFGIIRDYYEIKTGPHNPEVFFVSYASNPKQSPSAKVFGGYAVTFPYSPGANSSAR